MKTLKLHKHSTISRQFFLVIKNNYSVVLIIVFCGKKNLHYSILIIVIVALFYLHLYISLYTDFYIEPAHTHTKFVNFGKDAIALFTWSRFTFFILAGNCAHLCAGFAW